ncbi:HAMP domain-containing sensor histidine kinase [Eubacteriaceae bacterium ES2]|nr:HAMP domain-containing sensor histidine kinase [Eubacteriaceae bacterium ES2]
MYHVIEIILLGAFFLAFLIFFNRYLRIRQEISQLENELEKSISQDRPSALYTKAGNNTEQLTYQINQLLMRYQRERIDLSHEQTLRKQLIANLSHDLKTPLAGIIGYLEAIDSELVSGAEKKEYLETALNKSYDLKHRIRELFELVRIDANEEDFQFEKVAIDETLRQIAIEFVPKLEASLFQYEFDIVDKSCPIQTDIKAFKRIMQNLIGNVFDHASRGKYLAIKAYPAHHNMIIEVIDHGGGIADKDARYIFDRLYQGDEARLNHGGLGLAITCELVNKLNGTISLAVNTPQKTIFKLSFPLENVN